MISFCLFPDDLDIAPDFYEYFAATYRILLQDETLWCVSAWNDNGKTNLVKDDPGKPIFNSWGKPGEVPYRSL